MGRPPYRLLRKDDRMRIKYIQQRYEKPSGTRELTGGERKYLLDKRREILQVIADLVWFAEELPEDQLCQVFTEENIDKLTSALLTQGTNRSRSEDKHRQELIEREYRIAVIFMEKGADKCLVAFERQELESPLHLGMGSPLYQLVRREAASAIHVLSYVARGGVYKPKPARAKRERHQRHEK